MEKNNEGTLLKYWEDPSLMEIRAELIEVRQEQNGKIGLVFDQTVFYPQGGGQPSDIGQLSIGENVFNVHFVYLDHGTQRVVHVLADGESFKVSEGTFDMFVDSEFRNLAMQYHTYSHVLDLYFRMGNDLNLGPFIKGKQFPEEAYMTVEGVYTGNSDDVMREINMEVDRLKSQNLGMNTKIELVEGSVVRSTWFDGYEDFAVGCGGTHVENTSELNQFEVFKIKPNSKKGTTTVWFRMLGN